MINYLPVFIMGAPRSGTTLLASLLSSRKDAIGLPEMHYMHYLLRREILYGYLSYENQEKYLKNHFMFRELEIASSENELKQIIANPIRKTIENIITAYNEKYYNKPFQYWIENTPHNYEYFNELIATFNNARFIHIVRDGRAVYRSTINTDWSYKDVIRGAKHWKNAVEKCLILERAFPSKIKTVKYEELTENTTGTLKDLCAFLEINFEESMLENKGIRKPKFSKYLETLGEKTNTKSNYLWKKELKKDEISHFTAFCYNLLKRLNYPVNKIKLKEIKGLKKNFFLLNGRIKSYFSSRKAKKRFNK
jgi:hypothetical protein